MNPTTEDQHAAPQQAEPWIPTQPAPAAQQDPAAAQQNPTPSYPAPDARTRDPEIAPAPLAPVARNRRKRLIALLVIGGIVLLGAGFGIGYAVGNATATPAMGQFDPSQMGGGPGGDGGGFGGPAGPGGGAGIDTDSGTSDGTAS